jgi:hypothetical protein
MFHSRWTKGSSDLGDAKRAHEASLLMVESEHVVGRRHPALLQEGRRSVRPRVLLAIALSAACGRSHLDPGEGGTGGVGGSAVVATGGTGTGGTGVGGAGGTGMGGTITGGQGGKMGEPGGAGMPQACLPTPRAAATRQLTRFQYDNVLRDVLGDDSAPAQRVPHDDIDEDLSVDGTSNSGWVANVHVVAHEFALAATASSAALSATLACDFEGDGEAACEARLLESTLPRLFRRPLDAADLDEFEALLGEGAELGGDFASGVRLVLEVALQSPELLYRIERGEPLDVPPSDPRSGWARPTPFEMASRLSFLIWGSAPDDTLLAEAAAGGLRTNEGVRAAALRLLDDERAIALIRYIHLRLLGQLDRPRADEAWAHPKTKQIFALMQDETFAFLDDVATSGAGGFTLLLTAPYTYLNEELAAFYGIPNVAGSELRQVNLSPTAYSGILTHGSFLTTRSWADSTVPPNRGRAVLAAFLCMGGSLHPPDKPPSLPSPPPGTTTRELFEEATYTDPSCAGCHSLLNPPGFALEHFDHAGRYRDTEASKPIDAAVEIEIDGIRKPALGAPGLGRLLAESPQAHDCYVQNWAGYGYAASTEAPLDECSRSQLADVFERTNGDLRALVLELTQTDAFLYLAPKEP